MKKKKMNIDTHIKYHACTPEKKYPWIGIVLDKQLVVIFKECKRGTVVNKGESPYDIGHVCNHWDMKKFEEFDGKIIIDTTNDKS